MLEMPYPALNFQRHSSVPVVNNRFLSCDAKIGSRTHVSTFVRRELNVPWNSVASLMLERYIDASATWISSSSSRESGIGYSEADVTFFSRKHRVGGDPLSQLSRPALTRLGGCFRHQDYELVRRHSGPDVPNGGILIQTDLGHPTAQRYQKGSDYSKNGLRKKCEHKIVD